MHDHQPHTIERHCDVAVVGGSAAGLAGALQLAQQRRSVIVIDGGEPRNAPAAHMHGYLGYEGRPPADLTRTGREEVRAHGCEIIDGHVAGVTGTHESGFRIVLEPGHTVVARRVLIATGLVDELPDIDGVAQRWGHEVIHCPFCHGYDARDRRVVQIITHPMGLHPAALFRQLTTDLTLVLHGGVDADGDELDALRRADVAIRTGDVRRVTTGDGHLLVEMDDETTIAADRIAIGPRFRVRADMVAGLGVSTVAHGSGLGDHLETDDMGQTSTRGIYAAGNVTDPSHQVLQAAADGSRTGAMISFDLAREDLETAGRPSGRQADWDHRYDGKPIWSGNPNGTMVAEVDGTTPGRALDVGAGEGADALWLAQHGWDVTATDISARALDRVSAEAERRGERVTCLLADANALTPFGSESFDLVSLQYPSIPRTPDDRGLQNLLDAVAPGGTLLVVGHAMDAHAHEHQGTRPFDHLAYVGVEEIAAALDDEWTIEVHETRSRPPGAVSTHHVVDVVLRARRR